MNYVLITLVIVVAIIMIYLIVRYPKLVKNWLVYACAVAEKEMGSKTGQLKLQYVYNLFVAKFPIFSTLVSFTTFSKWVDIALIKLSDLLKNVEIKDYIVKG